MSRPDRKHATLGIWAASLLALFLAQPGFAEEAEDFESALARVDQALQDPHHGIASARHSCLGRRDTAVRLWMTGQPARAKRALRYCMEVLNLPEEAPRVAKARGPSAEELSARAEREMEKALRSKPDLENGLEIYRSCSGCHLPEGFGLRNGTVPQIAGQHRRVIVKQLADIRAGNRDAFLMLPYASAESIGGAQAVADVTGYIDTLEISIENGKGPGDDLALGERLYSEHCARCHGDEGQGNDEDFVPRIHAQHYRYLVRQFEWIRDGKRRNANPDMVQQIRDFDERQIHAVLDYVSRLEPPEDFVAPPGWRNPDFER